MAVSVSKHKGFEHGSYHQVCALSINKKPLTSDDIIQKLTKITKSPHFIVLEGGPGIGKTSLLKHISNAVIPSLYVNLEQGIYHTDYVKLKEYIEKERTIHHPHLLLFDGFDEFICNCTWDLSLFHSLLHDANVVVATRYKGVNHLYEYFQVNQHYIIQGFTNCCGYFNSNTTQNEFEQVKYLLDHYKSLKELCKIPLICSELIKFLRSKKFQLLNLSLTEIFHEIVLAIIKQESKEISPEITNLYSLSGNSGKSLQIISKLALSDLVCQEDFNFLLPTSVFLSSFCLENSISSLDEIKTLGLIGHCEHSSVYARIKKRIFWFYSNEICNFLAAFTLHQYPPLDQLYFLTKHAKNLLDSGRHEWLRFFYGLTVRREAEYNPSRMMMASLSELLVYCLKLEKESTHRISFINCLTETRESSLFKKLGMKYENMFEFHISIDDLKIVRSCLVMMISDSGFKEWAIETSSKNFDEARKLMAYIVTVKIDLRKNESLNEEVQLKPTKLHRASNTFAKVASSTHEDRKIKLDLFYCRAIREILQRVFQLFSVIKLLGDSSNPSYVSFLSCKCFKDAFEDHVLFEPFLPIHFLTVENNPIKSKRNDASAHLNEVHDGKALELIIFLQPCLKRIEFMLPSGREKFEIEMYGNYMPDTVYEEFVSSLIQELEEIVQCSVPQESCPLKSEKVVSSIALPTLASTENTVAPAIFLPPNMTNMKIGDQQNEGSSATGDDIKSDSHKQQSSVNYPQQQTSNAQEPSLRVTSIQTHISHSSVLQQAPGFGVAVQPSQPSKRLAAMRPGTVVFTTIPKKIPADCVYPLPDESILIRRGGNGQIFEGTMQGVKVAVKKTSYRSKEYALITKLKHANIIPLLAFMWGKENPLQRRRYFCYHIMPKMTGKYLYYRIMFFYFHWRGGISIGNAFEFVHIFIEVFYFCFPLPTTKIAKLK